MRKGQFGLKGVIEVAALLMVFLVVAVMLGDFVSPVLADLADIFYGETDESVVVGSMRALTYATSCSAIASSAPPEGEDHYSVYTGDWNTPFNRQNFGSDIRFSCNQSARNRWQPEGSEGVRFQGEVEVVCDTFQNDNHECRIYGFTLPQKVPYTGLEVWSGELTADFFPDSFGDAAVSAADYVAGVLMAQGQPNYVAYYQKVPDRAMGSWTRRTQGMNFVAIAGAGAINMLAVGIEGGGAILKKSAGNLIGKVTSTSTWSTVDDYISAVKGKAAIASDISDKALASLISKGDNVAAAGSSYLPVQTRDDYFTTFVTKSGDEVADTAVGLKMMGSAAQRSVKRLFNQKRLANTRILVGGMWSWTRSTMDGVIGWAGTKLMMRESVEGIAVRDAAMEEFYSRLGTQYAIRMADDYPYLIRNMERQGNDIVFPGSERQVVMDSLEDDAAENIADAARAAADNTDDLTVTQRNRILDELAANDGFEQFGENYADQLDEIILSAEAFGRRTEWEGVAYSRAMSGTQMFKYALRNHKTVKQMTNKLYRAADAGQESTIAQFAEDAGAQASALRRWAGSGRTGKLVSGAQRTKEGAVRVIRSAQAGFCSSRMLQSVVLEEIANNMGGQARSFWRGVGRCAALAGDVTTSRFCRGAGIRNADTNIGTFDTKYCAAATMIGYAADRAVSDQWMTRPGEINSLYLKAPHDPAMEFPMHPVANYFMVGLNRGGGNPNERFFLASPMYTEGVQGAGDMHISVRPGLFRHGMAGDDFADPSGGKGPRHTLDPPPWATEWWEAPLNWVRQGMRFVEDMSEYLGGVPLVGGLFRADCVENNANSDAVPLDVAQECERKGTAYISSSDGSDEMIYLSKPQIRTYPGFLRGEDGAHEYSFIPENSFGGGDLAEARIWNSTNRDANSTQIATITSYSQSRPVPGGMEVEELRFRNREDRGCFVALCEEDNGQEAINSEGEVSDNGNCEKFDSPGSVDDKQTRLWGMYCEQETTGGDQQIGNNVYQMSNAMSPTQGIFEPSQLWEWDGQCAESRGCRIDWARRYEFFPDAGDLPYSGEFEDSNELATMYPLLGPNATGVTKYTDSTHLAGAAADILGSADLTSMTRHKNLRTLIVDIEGAPSNDNWKLEEEAPSGRSYAVYGYNADIQSNEYIKVTVHSLAIAAEIAIAAGSFGLGTVVVASGVGGAGAEMASQYVSLKSSWPNH